MGEDEDEDDDEEGDGGGSPGAATIPTRMLHCIISKSLGPSGYVELLAGHAVGEISTGGLPLPDPIVYHNNVPTGYDCGDGDSAGTVLNTTSLFFRLGALTAIDRHVNVGGTVIVEFDIAVWTDTGAACGFSLYDDPAAKTWGPYTLVGTEREYLSGDPWDTSASGMGFIVPAPPAGVSRWIRYDIWVQVDPTNGPPVADSESGCVKITGA